MRYGTLGAGGPTVSAVGLGLAALGRPGYINVGHGVDLAGRDSVDALGAHAGDMLDAAIAAGITYVDAARSYGRAEAFLAVWLDERPENDWPVIGSKWGYVYTADWQTDADVHEVKHHDLATLDRQLAETRDLLGDALDVYQIHSATEESGVLANPEVLERLGELRDTGLRIGFTVSGPNQADMIRHGLTIEIGGQPLFATVQATWNLLEPSAEATLAAAHDAGLGVIVKEVLANGRLAAGTWAAGTGFGPDAVAIAAALHRPWADVVLSGAATEEQLAANLRALAVPESAVVDLADRAEHPAAYWGTRSSLPWN